MLIIKEDLLLKFKYLCILESIKDYFHYYYIELTDNVNECFQKHINGEGCEWTKIYKPFRYRVISNVLSIDLDDYVIKYMYKYGIDYVRGGSYHSIKLNDKIIKYIKTEIWNRTDKCIRCGRSHAIIDDIFRCDQIKDIDGNVIDSEPINESSPTHICHICNTLFYDETFYKKHKHICVKRKYYYELKKSNILCLEPWNNRISF